ncbi:choloylglycine hydrolase [Pseudomonas sp. ABAC61]|nr:choloylglycine hydrolase [Pseudomonas sp. ABAC61]
MPHAIKWILTAVVSFFSFLPMAYSCTRLVFLGDNQQIFTARSMDWAKDVETNLWIFPQGMKRHGEAGPNSVTWTSKYGSVIASGYDISTTDGMNEVGLVANLLWLVESEYPKVDQRKAGLSIAAWAQYVLDNFKTVAEAVEVLKAEPFYVVTAPVPEETRLATLHLSISDASGDSAIIEYIAGKQVIHHNRSYQVMTNSPVFDEQLEMNKYWEGVDGTQMLPGTNRSPDRFARASFYVKAIPKNQDARFSAASVFSVIRNVSVPYGITTPDQPNISSTRWRTVADHKQKQYFFESTVTPNTFWVDLNKLDFSEVTGKVKKLDLGKDQRKVYSGEVSASFEESPPFKFEGI